MWHRHIDDAIDAQSRSFELASTLFAKPENTEITEHDVLARMLEIVRHFLYSKKNSPLKPSLPLNCMVV